MATNVLNNYIDKGKSLTSSVDLFNKLLSDSGKGGWLTGALSSLTGLMNNVTGGLDAFKGYINNTLDGFNLDSLLNKLGLGDNKLLKALADKFGLKSGLFDSWASDIINIGMSWVDSALGDLTGAAVLGVVSLLKDDSVYDQVILNSIVKPLRYTGSNPNYQNKLLKVCLESDLPKNLEYLDQYNNTQYDYTNTMWKRAIYSAQRGCYKVPKYICKILYKKYTDLSQGAATDNEEIAFVYKNWIIEIFKNVLVYSFDNFTDERFIEFINEFPLILKDFSYFGDNDEEMNNRYMITTSDIDVIAPKIELSEFDNGENKTNFEKSWKDPGCGLNFDATNITKIKEYIDIRNSYFKKIYIYMAHSDEIPSSKRLVNEKLHKRLEYKNVDILSKANSEMINSLKNSKLYNDFKYVFDTNGDSNGEGIVAGGIANMLSLLQDLRALFTIEEIYSVNNTLFAKKNDTSVGDFIGTNPDKSTSNNSNGGSNNSNNGSGNNDNGNNNNSGSGSNNGNGNNDNGDNNDSGSGSNNNGNNNGETNIDITTESDSYIDSSVTQEEISDELDNIFDNIPDTISVFITNDIKSSNFEVINITNLSAADIQNLCSKLFEKRPEFKLIETFDLKRINNNGVYNIKNLFMLYTDKSEEYEKISDEDKINIKKYLIAKYLIRNYSIKYSIQALKCLYGESKLIDDAYMSNVPDEKIAYYIDSLSSYINEIKNLYNEFNHDTFFKITFDLQEIGSSNIKEFDKIKPLTSASAYRPIDPVDETKQYLFIGWSENINGSEMFNFDERFIDRNITLYAIWSKIENYILSATLRKVDNPTLETDIFGTIDNINNKVFFPIKDNERTDDDSYVIKLSVSSGANSPLLDSNNTTIVLSPDQPYEIEVTDSNDVLRRYLIEMVETLDSEYRISYFTNGIQLNDLDESDIHYENSKTELLTASKSGYNFVGWKNNPNLIGDVITSLSTTVNKEFEVLYPVFEEITYKISYYDKMELPFSGIHRGSYPITASFNRGVVLDKPSKKDYIFMGYHKSIDCTDEPVKRLPRFSVSDDVSLYADWMDKDAYNVLYGLVPLKGIDIHILDLIFYTTFVLRDNRVLKINEFGFGLYSNNIKTRDLDVDKQIALGVTYIQEIDTFFVLTKNSDGTIKRIYYTDRNFNEYKIFVELTDISKIKFFAGIGFETLSNLVFFLKCLYKGSLFEAKNNAIYINETIIFNKDNIDIWPNETNNPLMGISFTISGSLYVLFHNHGIIRIYDFEIVYDSEGIPSIKDNQFSYEFVSSLTDQNVDTSSIGTTYNNIDPYIENNTSDDININDPETIRKTLINMKEKYTIMHTYKNPGEVKYVESESGLIIPVLPESIDGDWVWKVKDNTSSILYLFNYDGKGQYTLPDIRSPKIDITLFRRDNPKLLNPDSLEDIFEYQPITINKNNYKSYIGWTRRNNDEEILLTKEYMDEYWSDKDNSDETWTIKLDRSEVQPLSDTDNTPVYKGRKEDIVPSDLFNQHNDTDIESLTATAISSQKELADKYKKEIFVSTDKTGKKRYDGITEAYYKYITEDYKKDRGQ